jgi:hypothetical protein
MSHRANSPLQDLITDDEIISDSYDIKEIDGVAYEADCRKITVGGESFGAHFLPPWSTRQQCRLTATQTPVPTLLLRRLRRVPKTTRSRSLMSSTLSV